MGKLYNWYAVIDPRGLAPNGWHIPNKEECETLNKFLGSDASKLKSTWGWSVNGNGTNISGFSSLPTGFRDWNGSYFGTGGGFRMWTSQAYESMYASHFEIDTTSYISFSGKTNGLVVRCVKD